METAALRFIFCFVRREQGADLVSAITHLLLFVLVLMLELELELC